MFRVLVANIGIFLKFYFLKLQKETQNKDFGAD